jgi:hypothetical protein
MVENSTVFNKNVFINCPYDEKYLPLLKVIIFTVLNLGFNPELALIRNDSSENRIDKIVNLIDECKYSIHDLSRAESMKKGEIARFNMPFELGIDYGCLKFCDSHRNKRFLILDEEKYRYRRALSDLSGVDIESHKNNELQAAKCIRDWLSNKSENIGIPSGKMIFEDYYMMKFQPWFLEEVKKSGWDETNYDELPISEYITYVRKWLDDRDDGSGMSIAHASTGRGNS